MAIVVRRFGADGAWIDLRLEGDVSAGRGTDNQVQLPGLLVAIHHARIRQTGPAMLAIECLSSAGIVVNDRPVSQQVALQIGDEVRFGPHAMRPISVIGDGDILVEVREAEVRRGLDVPGGATSLAAAGWKMRRPAWAGLVAVLVLLLILPLFFRYLSLPSWVAAVLPTDRLWSSGQISNGHLSFGSDCKLCHASLLGRVENKSCLACHGAVAPHGPHAAAMQESGLDQARCASCHLEHGASHAVLPRHPAVCVDCHGDPQSFASLSKTGTARDFADHHPEFRMTVSQFAGGQWTMQRQVWTSEIRDQSGLYFSHERHLRKEGIQGPEGRQVLSCQSCHTRQKDAPQFEPVSFERHCQSCHQLDIKTGDEELRLPHGDEKAARALLVAKLAALKVIPVSTPEQAARRRPGDEPSIANSDIDPIEQIIGRTACGNCHLTERRGETYTVVPPASPASRMPHASFTHVRHAAVQCETCHAAGASSNSDELLLMGIGSCRQCHGGVVSSNRIRTVCIDCHRFHGEAAPSPPSKFLGGLVDGALQGGGSEPR